MKRTTIILAFAFFAGLLSAQSDYHVSLSAMAGTSLERGIVGGALTFEDRKFQLTFSAAVDDQTNPFVQIKPGITIAREGKSRILISPLWLKGGKHNEFIMAHGFSWTRPLGQKTSINLGVDAWAKPKTEPVWPSKNGEFIWSPYLMLRYDLLGSSYNPNKVVKLGKIKIWHEVTDKGYPIFTKTKLIGYGLLFCGGFLDGVVEGNNFQGRTAFEEKYGADPYGYFGSKSYLNEKDHFFKRDFYHNAEDGRVALYMAGSVTLGLGGAKMNGRWWHYLIDFGIGWTVKAFAKSRGMNYIRD